MSLLRIVMGKIKLLLSCKCAPHRAEAEQSYHKDHQDNARRA